MKKKHLVSECNICSTLMMMRLVIMSMMMTWMRLRTSSVSDLLMKSKITMTMTMRMRMRKKHLVSKCDIRSTIKVFSQLRRGEIDC